MEMLADWPDKVAALTVYQPFANQIVTGAKVIEYRTWSTKRRGWILIHAAAMADESCTDEEMYNLDFGGIVGAVRLTDVVDGAGRAKRWLLADPLKLAEPIYCKGAQGLWYPSNEVAAAAKRQFEAIVAAGPLARSC